MSGFLPVSPNPLCGQTTQNIVSPTPVNELLVMDFDQTVTVPDTITGLANLTYSHYEKEHPNDSTRYQTWKYLEQGYGKDYSDFQAWWAEERPSRMKQNAGKCKDENRGCLTVTDLGEFLAKSDESERNSLERINHSKFFSDLDKLTILEYGAQGISMKEGATDTIRHWLSRANYENHPWKYDKAYQVKMTKSEKIRLTEGKAYIPASNRDWAVISLNWSRDLLLGALLPFMGVSVDELTGMDVSSTHPLEFYCHLINKIYCGDMDFTAVKSLDASAELSQEELEKANKKRLATSVSKGTLDAPIRTGMDKLLYFRRLIRSHQTNRALSSELSISSPNDSRSIFTIYIGDGVNDLLPMMEASVGIVIGQNKETLQWIEDLDIQLEKELPEYQELVKRHHRKTLQGLCVRRRARPVVKHYKMSIRMPHKQHVLYQIDSWEEFHNWANRA